MLRDKLFLLGQRLVESDLVILTPFSWIYAFFVRARNFLYDQKILKSYSVNSFVISVGNIVAGGTGKTPFVHLLAKTLSSYYKVAILSRGYGAVPDEALLLAKGLENVRVLVGKDRLKIAKSVQDRFDLLILDDGFQYRKLQKDFEIVLQKKGERHFLPRGFLRDDPKRLKKADALFSKEDFQIKVLGIFDLQEKKISSLEGKKVGIFSGIAHPKEFLKTVQNLNISPLKEKIFADHAKIRAKDLDPNFCWICTEKDAVKLGREEFFQFEIYFLKIELEPVSLEWQKLIEKIEKKLDNSKELRRL